MATKKNPPTRKWSTKTLYRHLIGYLDDIVVGSDYSVEDLLNQMKDDIVAEETGMPGQTAIPVDES
jgi:hypothetical protein